jgi:PKD repeat protein
LAAVAGCGGGSGSSGGGSKQTTQSPTANANGPYTGSVGVAISFSSAGSSDPQAQALTYSWNFGDNTTPVTGASPTHAYTAAGAYTVSLTVTDTGGLTGTATSKATVLAPPTANAGGPYSGTSGTAINFSGAGSSDPQGQTLTYAWNFGDSTTGTGVNPSHTYTATGTYTVSLTVTDTSGLTGTATTTARVVLADTALTGTVSSGTQPVSGAHVYLLAANTTGYGGPAIAASSANASISLLNAGLTGASSSLGAYVTTSSSGAFSISGDYTCATGQQLYLYATGATGAAWMAAVGACQGTSAPAITAAVNEVSTIAAAYAFAGFATDATHVSSSGTTLAQIGIANAFANAANLAALSTGTALATTPAGNGTVPQSEINTLANILESCSSSGAQCTTLFADATADGTPSGAKPTETATAAINIAHHPAANVAALFTLSNTGTPPFTPNLSSQPNDFTVGLVFTGGGLNAPSSIAIDGSGNAWLANYNNANGTSISKFSSVGAALSPSAGYTGGGLNGPASIAIDRSGNAWIANYGTNSVSEFSNAGAALSPPTGYTGGGLDQPFTPPSLSIDGSGNVWVASVVGNDISEFSNAGAPLSSTGYTSAATIQPYGVAVDGSGDVWAADLGYNTVAPNLSKFSNAGVALSSSTGYAGGGLSSPEAIAIDSTGDVWIANYYANCISEFSNAGAALSSSTGFTGGGLYSPAGISIDGAGNIWTVNQFANGGSFAAISEFTSAGVALTPSTGYISGAMVGSKSIAIDPSGDIWVPDSSSGVNAVSEVIGVAAPVITPIAAGLPSTPTVNGSSNLGTRP